MFRPAVLHNVLQLTSADVLAGSTAPPANCGQSGCPCVLQAAVPGGSYKLSAGVPTAAVHVRRMTFEKEGVREAAMRAAQASSDLAATAQKIAIGQTYIPSHMDREHRRLTSRAVPAKVGARTRGCPGAALMLLWLSTDHSRAAPALLRGTVFMPVQMGRWQDCAWRHALQSCLSTGFCRAVPRVGAPMCSWVLTAANSLPSWAASALLAGDKVLLCGGGP